MQNEVGYPMTGIQAAFETIGGSGQPIAGGANADQFRLSNRRPREPYPSAATAWTLSREAAMVQISAQGQRNEYWRRRLLLGLMVPERYATVWISEGAREHPGALEALARLLTCPVQVDPEINREGDCDWLRTIIDGVDFDLFVNCYAHGEQPKRGSGDPSDDDLTTRLYSLMLSSEYAEPGSGPA